MLLKGATVLSVGLSGVNGLSRVWSRSHSMLRAITNPTRERTVDHERDYEQMGGTAERAEDGTIDEDRTERARRRRSRTSLGAPNLRF